jgi:hypothetical protein
MDEVQVEAPGGFVPQIALTFGARDGAAVAVDRANPLPTRAVTAAAASVPLAGASADSGVFGPFAPDLSRAIVVTLAGEWSGTVTLLRSSDNGATRRPLTFIDGSPKGVWSGNVNAAIGEESVAGATYYLQFARTAGTLSYRVEQ